jgi:hypothetical protein
MKQRQTIIIMGMILFAAAVQAAELKISESTIDYGSIKEGPPVIKKIILTNVGPQSLTIANARAS